MERYRMERRKKWLLRKWWHIQDFIEDFLFGVIVVAGIATVIFLWAAHR